MVLLSFLHETLQYVKIFSTALSWFVVEQKNPFSLTQRLCFYTRFLLTILIFYIRQLHDLYFYFNCYKSLTRIVFSVWRYRETFYVSSDNIRALMEEHRINMAVRSVSTYLHSYLSVVVQGEFFIRDSKNPRLRAVYLNFQISTELCCLNVLSNAKQNRLLQILRSSQTRGEA